MFLRQIQERRHALEAPLLDSDLEIREALPDDAHAIAALYVWHVLNGRASFEEIPHR